MRHVLVPRREDFIRNLTIASVAVGLMHLSLGNWPEVWATIFSAGIGIPLAAWYQHRRAAPPRPEGAPDERDVTGTPRYLSW